MEKEDKNVIVYSLMMTLKMDGSWILAKNQEKKSWMCHYYSGSGYKALYERSFYSVQPFLQNSRPLSSF